MKSHSDPSRVHLIAQHRSNQGGLISFVTFSAVQRIEVEGSPSLFPPSPPLGGWRKFMTGNIKDMNMFGESKYDIVYSDLVTYAIPAFSGVRAI